MQDFSAQPRLNFTYFDKSCDVFEKPTDDVFMKLFTALALFGLLYFAPTASAQTQSQSLLTEFKELERRRSEAIAKHDEKFLDRIYAEDFQGVTATGVEVDKARLMSVFKLDNPETVFTNEVLTVKQYEKTVVLTGRLTAQNKAGELLSESRYIHVYIKTSDGWQIVAGQGTLISQAKK